MAIMTYLFENKTTFHKPTESSYKRCPILVCPIFKSVKMYLYEVKGRKSNICSVLSYGSKRVTRFSSTMLDKIG